MRKIILVTVSLLALLFSVITVNAATATTDYIVADASELINTVTLIHSNGGFALSKSVVNDTVLGRSFVEGYPNNSLAAANDNTGLKFVLTNLFDGYNAKDYPYIKIGYKAQIAASKCQADMNMGVKYNGADGRITGVKLSYDQTGTYNSMVIDLQEFLKVTIGTVSEDFDYNLIDAAPIDYVLFKPYYSKKAISQDDYLMVEYIGAFKTPEAANAYIHPPMEIELSINYTAFRLAAGESFTIKPAVNGLEGAKFTFNSEDKTIATVDANGKVTALKNGITTVSVSYGEETVDCMVVVGKPETVTIVEAGVYNNGNIVKVNALGDSITQYSAPGALMYHKWWAINYNIQNRNYGIGGTRISKTEGAEEDNSFQTRALTMDEDADLITVKGGVNDWLQNAPIGEAGTKDPNTFEGGLRNLIENLIKRYPTKPIVFFTPIKCLRTSTNTISLSDYADRVLSVCAEYGIPAIDILRAEETDFTDNPEEMFYDGDLHPNDTAERIMSEYMMDQMVAKGIIKINDESSFTPVTIGEHYAFDAQELSDLVTVPAGISKTLSDSKLRIVADSAVSNAQVTISLADEDVPLKEFNVIRIEYKTNINAEKMGATVDFNIQTTYDNNGTRKSFSLFSYKPIFIPSEEDEHFVEVFGNSTFPNSSLGSGIGYDKADDESEYDKIVLKLWYNNNNTSVTDTYFEIEAISFYKTIEEAYSAGYAVNPEAIEVSDTLTVEQGTITNLDVEITPSTAKPKLVYTSDNESVARVTSDGNILAVKAGQATITVATEDGKLSDTCVVTVSALAKDYSGYVYDRNNLENIVYKLNKEKKLNVVYIGGSVTYGAGASDRDSTSWRALTGTWLKSMFPDADITLQNSAQGGSGSMLGAFRTDVDVLAHDPDLVFVEFSINDDYCGHDTDGTVQFYYESIIRQIREKSPDTEIISIFVTDRNHRNQTDMSPIAKLHNEVAAHYGVTGIDVGRALQDHIKSTDGSWGDYAQDLSHPLDTGYEIYANVVKQYLFNKLVNNPSVPSAITQHTVPSTYVDNRNKTFARDYVVVKEDIFDNLTGWTYSSKKALSYPIDTAGYIYPSADENSFTYTFKGTGIAFFMEFNGGQYYVEWSIDGESAKSLKVTDTNHPFNKMFKTGALEDKEHTITFSYKGTSGTGGTNPNVKLTRLLVSQVASEEQEPEILYGDVDGNGTVETADVVALARYNAKWTGYSESDIVLANADVDGDADVDPSDGVVLSRYFANWTGYEKLPMVNNA